MIYEMPSLENELAYVDALRAALQEIRALSDEVRNAGKRLSALEQKIKERRALVDNLTRLVGPERTRPLEAEFQDVLRTPTPVETGAGEVTRRTLAILLQERDRPFRANEVRERLEQVGLRPSAKAVHNAFQRLAQKGMLIKVDRGRYRAAGYGFGIQTPDRLIDADV